MKKQNRQRRRGFTLIEVLLVVAILGVIAAMVVPQLLGRQQGAMINAAKTSIQSLENTVKLYAVEHDGEYPASLEDLLVPEVRDGREIEPLLDKMPRDPWGSPLQYEYQPGMSKPRIWSWGPNRQEGGGDDISNYDDLD